MNRFLISIALWIAPLLAVAGTNVGVAVNVGQPGYYGQIDIGGAPAPQVIYPAPVVIQPAPPGVVVAPLYLYVPASHYHNWGFYCGRYNACGRPVFFVNSGWYRNTYVPYYHRHYHPNYNREYDHHHNQHYYKGNDQRYNR